MELDLRDIVLDYPVAATDGSLRALEGLSLHVGCGESVAVIGPSGCGKSTMLRIAAGLVRPTSGEASIDGAPIRGTRHDVALIPQSFGLLPWLDVYHNAELALKVRHVPRHQRRSRVTEALARVGLSGFERSFPAQLSGGMQQRLALARAIATRAGLLLMDEPLSAVDALLREELQDALLDQWQQAGYAQVLVTHSIEEAVFLGQRVVVMTPRPGRVAACVDNPGAGGRAYRDDPAFFERCREVRAALDGGARR